MIESARMLARYATGVPRFLRHEIGLQDSRRLIESRLEDREGSFLRLLERGVFPDARNPYCRLFASLGIEPGDVASLVRDRGLEPALAHLHDAGVRVSLEQFRGDRPLVVAGVELYCRPRDFDNPITATQFEVSSGGSRSAGRRVSVDLDCYADDAPYDHVFAETFDFAARPAAVWFPAPPSVAGLKRVLLGSKTGMSVERWFSQTPRPGLRSTKDTLLTTYALSAGRVMGKGLPGPEYTAPRDAVKVAGWLAEKREAGTPAMLATTPSSAVRVCRAAGEAGLDIGGSFFRCGGEPLTQARRRLIETASCRVACSYYITELGGLIGVACGAGAAIDDVHFAADKLALIQRQRTLSNGRTVGALHYTTLLASAPRIMINLESDDYAILERRSCGCPAGALGLDVHLHTIRSYEKLSSEGMNFLGLDLELLLEEVLPRRFGGGADDYQLLEEERDGLTRVAIIASPRLGRLEETAVVEAVLAFLAERGHAQRMMASVFEQSGTLRVLRREPHTTGAGKVLSLHLAGSEQESEERARQDSNLRPSVP